MRRSDRLAPAPGARPVNLFDLVLKAAFIVVVALLCGGTAMAEAPRPEDPASLLFEAPQWAATRPGATLSYRYTRNATRLCAHWGSSRCRTLACTHEGWKLQRANPRGNGARAPWLSVRGAFAARTQPRWPGVATPKSLPNRAEAFMAMAKEHGCSVKDIYGRPDCWFSLCGGTAPPLRHLRMVSVDTP